MEKDMALNVTILCKGAERYVAVWSEEQEAALRRTLGRWAADPGLSFTWCDAARMVQNVGRTNPRER